MITFFAIPRAFTDEFDALQRRAIKSWQRCAPGCQVILFGNDETVTRACRDLGVVQCRDLAYHVTGSPLVDTVFAAAERYSTQRWLCFVSCDIVFDSDLTAIVDALQDVERPFVIGQRRDMEDGDGLSGYVLHASCGVDYYLYRKGTIGKVLPFTVRGGGGDNWMVHKALTEWRMAVIDATDSIVAYHYPHGHPEWSNGKRGRQGSVEQSYNHALALSDGMCNAPGVESAPYRIVGNRFVHKSEVVTA